MGLVDIQLRWSLTMCSKIENSVGGDALIVQNTKGMFGNVFTFLFLCLFNFYFIFIKQKLKICLWSSIFRQFKNKNIFVLIFF